MSSDSRYRLRQLANGACSVHSISDAETFHPGIGPAAEAEALYVRQLRLPERFSNTRGEFVIWDVGFGAAANVLTTIRLLQETAPDARSEGILQRQLVIHSFDQTTAAAAFALEHADALGYFQGFVEPVTQLVETHSVSFKFPGAEVRWMLHVGDFPTWLKERAALDDVQPAVPSPHAILFDPHSPKKNPSMWTVSLFFDLFRCLSKERPCSLANFTRSTMARAAILLGGFFVGAGHSTGMKEETTVASNCFELLGEPLDRRWLDRAKRSGSAEPLWEPVYRQAALTAETLRKLEAHPQFEPLLSR